MGKPDRGVQNAAYKLKALIDVGATSFGSETFARGRISHSTMRFSVKVRRKFSSVLREYQIDLKQDVRAVATRAAHADCVTNIARALFEQVYGRTIILRARRGPE